MNDLNDKERKILTRAADILRDRHAARENVERLGSIQKVAEWSLLRYGGDRAEKSVVIGLDCAARVVVENLVTMGTVDNCMMPMREIFRALLVKDAVVGVLLHNHPSGDSTPSKPDKELTERIVAVGLTLGIEISDHLVIGGDSVYSIRAGKVIHKL